MTVCEYECLALVVPKCRRAIIVDVSPGLARVERNVCLDFIRSAMTFGVYYVLDIWVDSVQTVIVD